jgi:molybdate transport system permease protein
MPFAIAAGYALARWRSRWRPLFDTLVNLPLVLPPVVTGYLLLLLLGRRGPIGSLLDSWFGVRLSLTWQGAALAAAVVSFPLMVRATRVAFIGVDPRLESAAATLGAGPWRTFFSVSLPLAAHGAIAGAVLGFARGLGEFGATIVFAGNIEGETRTLPIAIFSLAQRPNGLAGGWRLVVLSIVIAFLALLFSEIFERRSRRRVDA